MATRVFALIIGIDKYKSGNIWNLESCVDDARSIKRWLSHDLHVPREQICMLTDAEATKGAIEDNFMNHLVNNPAIENGDAILVYFAGHGSSIRPPRGWHNMAKAVEVLCPYDHDSKSPEGRVAGISDRSFHAMLKDLSRTKGDNITVILDCCFTPSESVTDRKHTRWTPTIKAKGDDLSSGLWSSALNNAANLPRGFIGASSKSYLILSAARPGEVAVEGKNGGLFTRAFLSVVESNPLHNVTYGDLIDLIEEDMDGHKPALTGEHLERTVFDGIPFSPDPRFVPIDSCDDQTLRVDAGAIHGVVEGTEFTIHDHNRTSSLNPPRMTVLATEVHPTWCLARAKSQSKSILVREGWARVTRWNNRVPFRVHLRHSFFSLFRRCRLSRQLSSSASSSYSNSLREGVNIARVKHAAQADVSVTLRRQEMLLERHDTMIAANCRRVIHLPSTSTSSDLKQLDAAARFHLHLHRRNSGKPLMGQITMELYRLDSTTWTRVSGNLLVNGRAQIVDDEKNSVYSIVVHNYSDYDLWPYLVSMDSGGYSISMVYHPDSSLTEPPLRKHSHMVIGSGTLDSEALSFTLADGADTGAGFLKLFVSSVYTPMTFIEQGAAPSASMDYARPSIKGKAIQQSAMELWDSVVACVAIVRKHSASG